MERDQRRPPEVHRVSRKFKQVTIFERVQAKIDKFKRRSNNDAIRGPGVRVNGKVPPRGDNRGQGK